MKDSIKTAYVQKEIQKLVEVIRKELKVQIDVKTIKLDKDDVEDFLFDRGITLWAIYVNDSSMAPLKKLELFHLIFKKETLEDLLKENEI